MNKKRIIGCHGCQIFDTFFNGEEEEEEERIPFHYLFYVNFLLLPAWTIPVMMEMHAVSTHAVWCFNVIFFLLLSNHTIHTKIPFSSCFLKFLLFLSFFVLLFLTQSFTCVTFHCVHPCLPNAFGRQIFTQSNVTWQFCRVAMSERHVRTASRPEGDWTLAAAGGCTLQSGEEWTAGHCDGVFSLHHATATRRHRAALTTRNNTKDVVNDYHRQKEPKKKK